MAPSPTARAATYAGLLLVCLATLMFELLLTRVFSVTTYYHFAFVAVSVAMFGMTVGAIVVYLQPAWFSAEHAHDRLGLVALLFSVSLVPSLLAHLVIPFVPEASVLGFYSVALTYTIISIPFVFSGIIVSVALTRFPAQVGKLYAADLIGAALACVLFVYILKVVDGPVAVLMIAAAAAVAALCFARPRSRVGVAALAVTLLLFLAGSYGAWRSWNDAPLVRLLYVKGRPEQPPLWERWNSFSRVAVFEVGHKVPFGWGLSPAFRATTPVEQLDLNIDAAAATVLINPQGNPRSVDFLKWDITNLGYHLRSDGRALVVGVGGGRDVLSALTLGQREVVGVEINDQILHALNERFGDFAGHLDRDPAVRFVNDEARSYVARTDELFDIVQVSLIDTWAATAAGAFTFTENSLYTVEAWRMFLSRLTPRGLVTFSRWYYGVVPGETLRLVSLATSALQQIGVADPRSHILLAASQATAGGNGIGTILVSREPFTAEDVAHLRRLAAEQQFKVILAPDAATDPTLEALADPATAAGVIAASPLDLSPPTDDRPFFFHMLRWRNVLDNSLWAQGATAFNFQAVFILCALLAVTLGLTTLCIIGPLLLTTQRETRRGGAPLFWYFAAIGIGFMLVEISQMQRLNVFLGHPTYGLAAALFSLLLSSGVGSLTTSWGYDRVTPALRLTLLLAALAAFGLLTPAAVSAFTPASTPVRIVVAVLMLAPLGFFMGMAFPIGMALASRRAPTLTPWLWGINGATSVCASVIALIIALTWGISTSFWAGMGCYAVAWVAYSRAAAGDRASAHASAVAQLAASGS